MPVNPGIEYQLAEEDYHKARTVQEKIKALEKMFSTVPKHKSSEKLQQQIKQKTAKFRKLLILESKKKGSSVQLFKKEGSATIAIVGTTNSGKSTLLNKLTNANVEIASYPFTTKKPEIGIMDYKGIKIQVVEIPAIVENFNKTQNGPSLLNIIHQSDVIIELYKNSHEKKLIEKELAGFKKPVLKIPIVEKLPEMIWYNLPLIKVFTKMPGKEPDHPPVALKKGSNVKDLAFKIHKDFVKNFKFARVWGKSVTYQGLRVSLNHILYDDDIVELHTK